jgi:biotin transporter BioY
MERATSCVELAGNVIVELAGNVIMELTINIIVELTGNFIVELSFSLFKIVVEAIIQIRKQ